MYEQSFANQQPQQYTFKVGNITGQGVTLVDTQYNIIQLPLSILPHGSTSGAIIRITLMRDVETESREEKKLGQLIDRLETGGGGENIVDSVQENQIQEKNTIEETVANQKPDAQLKQQNQSKRDGMKKKATVEERQQKIKEIQQKSNQRQASQHKSKQKSTIERSSSRRKASTSKVQSQSK